MELPSYQSHKIVQAAKIESVSEPDNDGVVTLGLGWLGVQFVERDWFAAHTPEVGGYFVRYNDGYTSYSPAEAFENGYTPIDDKQPGDDPDKVPAHTCGLRDIGHEIALAMAIDVAKFRVQPDAESILADAAKFAAFLNE